jgi:hypothetical protein
MPSIRKVEDFRRLHGLHTVPAVRCFVNRAIRDIIPSNRATLTYPVDRCREIPPAAARAHIFLLRTCSGHPTTFFPEIQDVDARGNPPLTTSSGFRSLNLGPRPPGHHGVGVASNRVAPNSWPRGSPADRLAHSVCRAPPVVGRDHVGRGRWITPSQRALGNVEDRRTWSARKRRSARRSIGSRCSGPRRSLTLGLPDWARSASQPPPPRRREPGPRAPACLRPEGISPWPATRSR